MESAQLRDQLQATLGAQHVSKMLPVGDVLEASVRREGGRLRVTAQLVNTVTHLALGDARVHQWRWADAERELDRSVSLDPSNPTVHLWHAKMLLGMGDVAAAVGHAKMARVLDPFTAVTNQMLSGRLLDAR